MCPAFKPRLCKEWLPEKRKPLRKKAVFFAKKEKNMQAAYLISWKNNFKKEKLHNHEAKDFSM